MEALTFTRSGSRSEAGSRFMLGGILALLMILGMLAMHGEHLGSSSSQSTTAHVLATHVPGSYVPATHGASTSAVVVFNHAVSGVAGSGDAAAHSCANCATDELSMVANCLAAVVLGFLLLLPIMGEGRLLRRLRAGPQSHTMALPLPSTPSLQMLCINRS
ncbi:hypothetical protein [Specibacter sp. NPDC078692]|uniref:hypothetical protein n=1 Tax=Specibacter sp. NPDC078692 TaxID=3155818 RepID=UPI00342F6EFA